MIPAPDEPSLALSQWDRFLRDPLVDVEKLKALFELHERAEARSAKAAFNAAFAAMQGELPTIDKNGKAQMNGQTRYKYPLREDIIETVKPILQAHGFALRFRHEYHEKIVKVIGILSHQAGHSEQDEFECAADHSGSKNDIQAIGSTRSYGQRYTMMALLNLVSRDPADQRIIGDTDGHRTTPPAVPTAVPDGYEGWMLSMEAAAAKGTAVLYDAWKRATPAQRSAMPREVRERLKATAAQVSA